jgi:L-ascorbate metabolism protein UlaG (beta-lactamase superfamily)
MKDMMKKQHPIFKNNKYYNQKNEVVSVSLKETLWHYIKNIGNQSHIYASKLNNNAIPLNLFFKSFFLQYEKITSKDVMIIPLGHACILIIYQNKTILIDPLLGNSSLFLKRYADNIEIKSLPSIDIIIYSHNHPDHYNTHDLLLLLEHSPEAIIFAPTGFDYFLQKEGVINHQIKTLNWWEESTAFSQLITITALPAIHWSQSTLFDRNETLWASWMIEIGGVTIFFAGDTAYSNHFQSIKEYKKKIDIACLPIAPYTPIDMQIDSHINTDECFQAFLDLGCPLVIPIHWGVFAYGDEPLKEPIEKIITLFYKNNYIEKLQATIINTPLIYNIK